MPHAVRPKWVGVFFTIFLFLSLNPRSVRAGSGNSFYHLQELHQKDPNHVLAYAEAKGERGV